MHILLFNSKGNTQDSQSQSLILIVSVDHDVLREIRETTFPSNTLTFDISIIILLQQQLYDDRDQALQK